MNNLTIKTDTTGFASPADAYVDTRLDLNDLVCPNIHSTFYFKYSGEGAFGIRPGNVIVVDRSIEPKIDELVVVSTNDGFKLERYNNQENLWGRISWVLKKQ